MGGTVAVAEGARGMLIAARKGLSMTEESAENAKPIESVEEAMATGGGSRSPGYARGGGVCGGGGREGCVRRSS